jgi:hypothetical protein
MNVCKCTYGKLMNKKTIGLIFLLTCLLFSFAVAHGKNNSNIKLTDEEKNWL